MNDPRVKLQEVISVIRRRQRILIIPPALVMVACVIAVFVLPRKYESSTTILIRRDEILNPLVTAGMGVTLITDDRIKAFAEVVYSRVTMETLIDSLKLNIGQTTEGERQDLIRELQGSVDFTRGESTARLTFQGDNPRLVQRKVALLTRESIRRMIRVENKKNEVAVRFFEGKLLEYQEKYELAQKQILSLQQDRIAEMPDLGSSLLKQIDTISEQIRQIDNLMQRYEDGLNILALFPEAFRMEDGQQSLFTLRRLDLPFTVEIQPLLISYADLSLRYTSSYPGIIELESKILDLLNRMRAAIEYEIPEQRKIQEKLEGERAQLVSSLQQSSVTQQIDYDKTSTYALYQRIYDDMKTKLEQARTTQELNQMGEEQFVIIDPPVVPSYPTKPSRTGILLGGLVFGMMLGIVGTVLTELFDSTVRTPKDLGGFQPPVLAVLPDRQFETDQSRRSVAS